MRVLALIPARGGSKGFPGKNLALLAGRPLLEWTIQAALDCSCISRTVLSTDDAVIAEAGRRAGAETPFIRPGALAEDTTPALPVIVHAIETLAASGDLFDAVAYLQPTSPLRAAADVARAIALMAETGADTVVSVVPVPHPYSPTSLMQEGADGRLEFCAPPEARKFRRQDKERLFARNGPAILLTRTATLLRGELYGPHIRALPMHAFRSVDIDTAEDLLLAEAVAPLAAATLAGERA
jgi:CMP-N,N'-diacetyllegionaminic acid synthase